MKNPPEIQTPDNRIQMSQAHEPRLRPATPEVPPPAQNEVPGNLPPVQG